MLESLIRNARAILKSWGKNNAQKVSEYYKKHQWLPADISKVSCFAREHRLTTIAITRTDVYGLDLSGIEYVTSRSMLGIGDNFA